MGKIIGVQANSAATTASSASATGIVAPQPVIMGDLTEIELAAMQAARAKLAQQQAQPDQNYGREAVCWVLPLQQEQFGRYWWTISEAMAAWGCSYRTARRWALTQSGRARLVYIVRPRGACWRWVVPAGLQKSPALMGNPDFRRSEWQRGMVNRRWVAAKAAKPAARRVTAP